MQTNCIRSAWLALGLIFSQAAPAYDVSLSPQAVREAYFLGQRNDEKTAAFLSKYVERLALPKSGPYVTEIEILTPVAQVVQISRSRTIGYSAQQAEQDYRERGDTLRLRVLIRFTPTYALQSAFSSSQKATGRTGLALRAEDFWRDFAFHFTQRQDGKEKTVDPFDVWSDPYYVRHSKGGSVLDGAEVWLLLDAAEIASNTAKIEVLTPDGQHVTAEFDLEKLR